MAKSLLLSQCLAVKRERWRGTRITEVATSTFIFRSRRRLISLRLLFIYAAQSGLGLSTTYIQSHHFGDDIDVASCRLVSRLLVLLRPPPARRGCRVMCCGHPEPKELLALSKRLCQLAWPKAPAIHHLPARHFSKQRHTLAACVRSKSMIHSLRSASRTSDTRFLSGDCTRLHGVLMRCSSARQSRGTATESR
jgi:hypothetical protein